MTQLGELTAIGLLDSTAFECPFHDAVHDCDKPGKNEFEGDATVLGKALEDGKAGTSTVVRKDEPDASYSKTPYQEDDPDKASEESREVKIVSGNQDCIYPTAFSAHHLIPAKESLKRAKPLHKFMKKSMGKICCDLGYDVNGNENGVWLPGLHGVNSKGVNVWGSAPTSMPDKEQVGRLVVKRSGYTYAKLQGPKPGDAGAGAFAPNNMKWLYVQAAMKFLSPARQFHDRHPNYSGLVEKDLTSLGKRLEKIFGLVKDPDVAGCDKCKNRKKKTKSPPPVALLGTLNATSSTLRGKVRGFTQDNNYYTSSWCGPNAPARPVLTIKSRKTRRSK